MRAEQCVQSRNIAINDGLCGNFETAYGRILFYRAGECLKRRPVPEVIPSCDSQLGVAQIERGVPDLGVRHALWQPFDLRVEKARMLLMKDSDCSGIARSNRGEQFLGLTFELSRR